MSYSFVISAFSLSLTLSRHEKTGATYLSFGLSRFFRIAPLFYLLLAVHVVRSAYSGAFHSIVEMAANIAFVFGLCPGHQSGIVWASWTIGVEVLFYVSFPVIVMYFKGIRSLSILFLGTCLLWTAARFAANPYLVEDPRLLGFANHSILRYLPVFIVGILVYRVYMWIEHSTLSRGQRVFIACSAFLIGLLGLIAMIGFNPAPHTPLLNNAVFSPVDEAHIGALSYGFITLGLSILPIRLLVNSIFRFYGEISYSLYLWHPLVVFYLARMYHQIYEVTAFLPSTIGYLLCVALTLVVTTPIAVLTYHLIEKPGVRLGKVVFETIRAWGNPPVAIESLNVATEELVPSR